MEIGFYCITLKKCCVFFTFLLCTLSVCLKNKQLEIATRCLI